MNNNFSDIENQADQFEQEQILQQELNQDEEFQKLVNINLLIDINNELDQLWKYHPHNPNKIDIVERYDFLLKNKESLEQSI